MSASRLDASSMFGGSTQGRSVWGYRLPMETVQAHPNGLEFRSPSKLALWTELKICLELPGGHSPVCGTAVVVACDPDGRSGFRVSLLFLELPGAAAERWLRYARLRWV